MYICDQRDDGREKPGSNIEGEAPLCRDVVERKSAKIMENSDVKLEDSDGPELKGMSA